jgi:hypothetical protein
VGAPPRVGRARQDVLAQELEQTAAQNRSADSSARAVANNSTELELQQTVAQNRSCGKRQHRRSADGSTEADGGQIERLAAGKATKFTKRYRSEESGAGISDSPIGSPIGRPIVASPEASSAAPSAQLHQGCIASSSRLYRYWALNLATFLMGFSGPITNGGTRDNRGKFFSFGRALLPGRGGGGEERGGPDG